MSTTIEIDGIDFLINGKKTYAGREHEGRRIEGLLLNSRMVQSIFDDANAETRKLWSYPDTGVWDPDRNTTEFCAMLPTYRAHGLLGVTVGLQGGGSIYRPEVFENYLNSAFRPDGSLEPAYFSRLKRVLEAADARGMVVFVNYFYWKQQRFQSDEAVIRAAQGATDWLLASGHRNILVDLKNEVQQGDDILSSRRIHRVLDAVLATQHNGRRLITSTSTFPTNHLPDGEWHSRCDFLMPHGNNSFPDAWRAEIRALRQSDVVTGRPRPICCNEDSIDVANLDVSVDEGVSWGYYDQGYGCGQKQGKHDWTQHEREDSYEELSGFQTVPVNWSINTDYKRRFFDRVAAITGTATASH
jgi:hypothetical protein